MKYCSKCIYAYWHKSKYFCNIDDENIIIEGNNEACEDFAEARYTARLDPRMTTPRRKK